jgi:hypothetical protein
MEEERRRRLRRAEAKALGMAVLGGGGSYAVDNSRAFCSYTFLSHDFNLRCVMIYLHFIYIRVVELHNEKNNGFISYNFSFEM